MQNVNKHEILLTNKNPVSENTVLFRFSCNENYSFKAGQYAFFTIANKEYSDEKGNTRAFSFANSPLNKGTIEICARVNKSKFSAFLYTMNPGSILYLSDAKGDLHKFFEYSDKLVIFSGGLGITPVRSFLQDYHLINSHKSVVLFYANKNPSKAAFLDELLHLNRLNENLNFIPVFESHSSDNPDFVKGKIEAELISKHVSEPELYNFLILGPPEMVNKVESDLRNSGIQEKNIYTEKY